MNYSDLLGRALNISWRHKKLWWFGVISSLPGILAVLPLVVLSALMGFAASDPGMAYTLGDWMNSGAFFGIWIGYMAFMLLLMVAIYALATVGLIGPTLGALEVDAGREISFGALFKRSLAYFWRVLGLLALSMLGLMLFMVALEGIILLVTVVTLGFGMLLMMPLIIYPLMIAAYAYIELGVVVIIRDDMRTVDAIRRAWALFRQNLLPVSLLSLILYMAAMLVSFVVIIPVMMPLFIAPMLPVMVAAPGALPADPGFVTAALVLAGLFTLLAVPVIVFLSAWLMTFWQAAWALACNSLAPKSEEAHA